MVSELVVKGSLSKASPLPKVGHLTFCRYTCYLPRDTSCISGIFARFDMVKDHCTSPPQKKNLLNSKKPVSRVHHKSAANPPGRLERVEGVLRHFSDELRIRDDLSHPAEALGGAAPDQGVRG